jgi:hypothetical protein
MAWVPGEELRTLLEKVLTRAREASLVEFSDARKRIEHEQAAKGVLGGPVARRCIEVAGARIKSFADAASSELLAALTRVGALHSESVQWTRATVNAQVETLVRGLGGQIDALKTTAGLKGNAARLERYGLEAKRDVDIALSHVELSLPKPAPRPPRPMYQLLISSDEHAWNGSPITFERDRVFKYTDADVKARFGSFEPDTVTALLALPCVFAYEEPVGKPPLFGRLTHVLPAGHGVKLDYEIVPVDRFLTAADLEKAGAELGIRDRFERFHTHWALKEVDLAQVLAARGINLPRVSGRPRIDIETHHFDVALSFPGEKRALVDRIAQRLEQLLGANSVFYDAFYPGELAQPDLDTLLQNIYGQRSTLIVVVAGSDYQRKNWCGLEFRAIKQRIWAKEHRKVMIVRTDDGVVDGIFETDGYVDAQRFDARDLAGMIAGRVQELRAKQH